MNTPIWDFARAYRDAGGVRMHMPGHKGRPAEGSEGLDLTEITGADELYQARGIIRRSEENAAALFGTAATFYSAEGSSLCIRGMLALLREWALRQGRPLRVLAGRNAHKTLMTACALLDLEIEWLYPEPEEGLLSCAVTAEKLDRALAEKPCAAVFVTTPDYLGHLTDLRPLSEICRRRGALLLADNAHGAYLRFLPEDLHPMTRGADLCCDSAHKTFPCLTGAAYLHVSRRAPVFFRERAEAALSLFASTSPSWLILQSLDRMNARLAGDWPARLAGAVRRTAGEKAWLRERGRKTVGDEPMKLTLAPKARGYTGRELHALLREKGIEAEFADPDFLTLMPSPETEEKDWRRLRAALEGIPVRPVRAEKPPAPAIPERACGLREALLGPQEEIPVSLAEGRILADAAAGCPPAVPIAVSGERLSREAIACFRYYGIDRVRVLLQLK